MLTAHDYRIMLVFHYCCIIFTLLVVRLYKIRHIMLPEI